MHEKQDDLICEVAHYYSEKLAQYGDTPQGVDWNGEESQTLRFAQISKVIGNEDGFSLNDLGCGYGALLNFLSPKFPLISYLGIDVSEQMIAAARKRHQTQARARFLTGSEPDRLADFGVASGVFNVRVGRNEVEWFDYIQSALDILDRTSRQGFSFNCLTSYSDSAKKRDYLYYADPCQLFDLCKRRYSRDVALLHDYGLYEFTIIVRKSS